MVWQGNTVSEWQTILAKPNYVVLSSHTLDFLHPLVHKAILVSLFWVDSDPLFIVKNSFSTMRILHSLLYSRNFDNIATDKWNRKRKVKIWTRENKDEGGHRYLKVLFAILIYTSRSTKIMLRSNFLSSERYEKLVQRKAYPASKK